MWFCFAIKVVLRAMLLLLGIHSVRVKTTNAQNIELQLEENTLRYPLYVTVKIVVHAHSVC